MDFLITHKKLSGLWDQIETASTVELTDNTEFTQRERIITLLRVIALCLMLIVARNVQE